ncbi:MAG: NAD-dependent epimerase/dehydratase family protein [Pseudomonadota bacterium]
MSRIMVTGASGFLGKAVVKAAQAAGADVVALSRRAAPAEAGVTPVALDLGDHGAPEALEAVLEGVDTVIHAAARLIGTAEEHTRDTVGGTAHLTRALEAGGSQVKLVLVSSIAVYDVAAMENGTTLDEDMRLVETAEQRDHYAAAKAEQERHFRLYQGPKQLIRPGAIYGPNNLWSAQLGFAKGSMIFCPGGGALMPAISVERSAAALVRAALAEGSGETVNLIDPDPPTQIEWLAALGLRKIAVPLGLVYLVGALTGRGPAWQARFRPLRYDTSRAEALLEGVPHPGFAEAVKAAKAEERA